MEYVVFKGKEDILFTVDDNNPDKDAHLNAFGKNNHGAYILLPEHPCDLELFKDTFNEILTEIIKRKREINGK